MRTILTGPNDAFGLVDRPSATDAVETGRIQMPTLAVTEVRLVAMRAAETNRARLEQMTGRIEMLAAFRAGAGLEVPQGILAFEASHRTGSSDLVITENPWDFRCSGFIFQKGA